VNASWESITECLRNELQEYGALLSLFEDQQSNLFRRDADAVLALVSSIEEQARVTHSLRERREDSVRAFALEHGHSGETSLRQLLPHFPIEVRPLIEALTDEINHLIHRIRRDARQNQMLLSRTVELHEEALRVLRPGSMTKTYSRHGQVSLGAGPAWQAAG
jgi:flagellar biosynthesis/type III secretory pathway chaperone